MLFPAPGDEHGSILSGRLAHLFDELKKFTREGRVGFSFDRLGFTSRMRNEQDSVAKEQKWLPWGIYQSIKVAS